MTKRIKKMMKSNQGNSFIVVVATLSFLAVLTSALLVAVGLCYKLKAYDINSRDNFYYLEKAMDDIYQGIGSKTMEHLGEAYKDVTEVMVYYDIDKKTYTTMSNDDANKLLKESFMDKVTSDVDINSTSGVDAYLQTLISDLITNEGVTIQPVSNVTHDDKSLTIHNLVLKRVSKYSTINTYKDPSKIGAAADYVQSISTDIVVSCPAFKVDFNSLGNDDVYDYVFISDMGVEIEGIGTKSNINGNIYAASDFYNKDYNNDTNTRVAADTVNIINKTDGVSEKSMYSGLYVSKAKVAIMADKVIVPGSISAMNCAELTIFGSGKKSVDVADTDPTEEDKITDKYTQLWADNVIVGGYSRKTSAVADSPLNGSKVELRANAFIYDDTEVNADSSSLKLNGNYYGYNNGTTDKRTYSDAYIKAVTDGDVASLADGNYTDSSGKYYNLPGQSHYNSSSIVVNGKNTTLDLQKAQTMYLAGQAYVEMSKQAKSEAFKVRMDDDSVTFTDATAAETPYEYKDKSTDDYSVYSDGGSYEENRVQDYKTGESLSVKSNQLAYIPPYVVHDKPGDPLYVQWPAILSSAGDANYQQYVDDLPDEKKNVLAYLRSIPERFVDNYIPVVKTVVNGKTYYFYDFSGTNMKTEDDPNTGMPYEKVKPDEFIRKYAEAFELTDAQKAAGERSLGDIADLYDITDYEPFKVNCVLVDDNKTKIYSNSAISVKESDTDAALKVIGDQKSIMPLFKADNNFELNQSVTVTTDPTVASVNVTKGFNTKYKSLKLFLTESPNPKALSDNDVTTYSDTGITPINTYFNFENSKLEGDTASPSYTEMSTGYVVYQSKGDVEVKGTKVKGVVFCKGDVTFDSSVTEFQGLIVCGGKIKVDHSINFIANREIVKSIIAECKDGALHSKLTPSLGSLQQIYEIFKAYDKIEDSEKKVASDAESVKPVGSVMYEDILSYSNWAKNVD
ncbi:MAG: hypothetical protein K6G76_08880 [Lachnospiraceae bacterium]|nr:hypothetical protein [Lachnospiraceae bacterium]